MQDRSRAIVPSASPGGRLRRRYVAALGAVAALLVIGQILVQIALTDQARSAHLINTATSQRSHSQKLTRAVISLQRVAHPSVRRLRVAEVREALDEWQRTHLALKLGDPARGLPGARSADMQRLFAIIEPDFVHIQTTVASLLAEVDARGFVSLTPFELVEKIAQSEQSFLAGMDRLIEQYEREGTARVGRLRRLEIGLLALTLLVLGFEVVFIFRPAIARVDETIETLQQTLHDLESAKVRAEAATKEKSRFLATVSHEIRTPLNGVTGLTDALGDVVTSPEQRELVAGLRQCASVLMRLVNDVLDMASIESGRVELLATAVDIRTIVAETAEIFRYNLPPDGPRLVIEVAAEVPPVIMTDVGRLQQILVNLLGNALKFTPRGYVRLAVRTTGDGFLNVDVSDTGPGIGQDLLAKLFTPFVQGRDSMTRPQRGTGLGLAISRELATLLGGSLTVQTAEGVGSTFTLSIPLVVVDIGATGGAGMGAAGVSSTGDARTVVEGRPQLVPGPSAHLGTRTDAIAGHVLVAEDDAINQMVVTRLLRKLGCTFDLVWNGRDAVDAAMTRTYDAILMDCQMPEMDGLEAIRLIRASPGVTRVPILALTANVLADQRAACFDAGADDHLAKPITLERLGEALARCGVAVAHENGGRTVDDRRSRTA